MAFNDSSITFGAVGLQGESVNNPTAIDFSKSGKPVLFVTQQNGEVWRFEIEREADDGDGDTLPQFVVTDALKISDIKLETQNYNDDGTENSATNRQTTGLVTTTDANGNDVLYVNSSDWRIAVGNDSGLDTNSGQVHKIVLDKDTGAVISNVAIIRGLPRSEENHSTNGLDLSIDPATGDTILWIAQGGNTNKGAPGNNFAGTVDFALSGTVLKVNLTELEAYDIRTDGNGDQFILDLPTLNDPGRADIDLSSLNIQNLADAPNFALDDNGTGTNGELNPDWAGGNNGLNMAKIASKALVQDNGQLAIVDNPLSVHQPGHRNNYDVVVTQNGEVFSWDNGPNGGWGGQPLSFSDGNIVDDWTSELATNQFNESGSGGFGDQLTYAGETTDAFGPYAGDANPIRAAKEVLEAAFNPDGTYKPANSSDPVLDQDGVTEIFANETEARDYLSQLVMVWEEQGNGNWVNATPANLPADIHDIVSGYDWNHPGNSLSDPTSYYPQNGASLMDGTFFSPESELLPPGQDGSLKTVGASTNGLAEYTGTFFGGALNGAVIGASFNGNLYFEMPVDTDGDGRTDAVNSLGTINGFGSQPLGVTAVGDEGFSSGTLIDTNGDGVDDFAGLVIAATYGADNITFFVPGGTPADPSTDLDLDGLDNTNDSHIGDPLDGKGVTVGADQTALWDFEPNNPASTPAGAVPPGSSIAGGIGVNAVLRNGTDVQFDQNGPALYDPTIWNLGGASSFVSIDGDADTGSAEGSANDQADVLGIGFAVPSGIGGIKIAAEMNNIFDFQLNKDNGKTWDGGEKAGLIVGPGNQSTFVQATTVAVDQGGTVKYGLELLVEEDDTTATPLFVEVPGLGTADNGSSDGVIELEIDIDLSFGAEAASARVRFTDGGVFSDWFETGTLSLPADVVSALKGQFNNLGKPTGAFVGMIATAESGDDSFAAQWDSIQVDGIASDLTSQVLARVNAGGPLVSAIDGGPDWTADTSGNNSPFLADPGSNDTNGFPVSPGVTVPSSTPASIFTTERWDNSGGAEMEWAFDVPSAGLYEVRLFMGNGFPGTSSTGERVFDVAIEGNVPSNLQDVDLSAQFGHEVGAMVSNIVDVTDGTLNVEFLHQTENPLINGIEVLQLTPVSDDPVISILDAMVAEDDSSGTVTVTIQSDITVPLNDSVTVNYEIVPVANGAVPMQDYAAPSLTFDPATSTYSGSGSIAGGSADLTIPIEIVNDTDVEGDELFQVNIVSVSGSNASIGDGSATVTIQDDDQPAGGAVLFRVNTGGPELAAADGSSTPWSADTGNFGNAGNSPYLAASSTQGTFNAVGNSNGVPVTSLDPGVATAAPTELFNTERFDQPTDPEMLWEFPVVDGDYVVNLFFAEIFNQITDVGGSLPRIFDVSLEGTVPASFDDINQFGTFGAGTGFMLSESVNVTDGSLSIEFLHVDENPTIKGIEILSAAAPGSTAQVSVADVTVNEGDGTADVTFSLSGPVSEGPVTVSYTVTDNSASAGNDYTAPVTQEVTFAANATTATATFSINDDSTDEPDEEFSVSINTITAPSGATVTADTTANTAVVTIEDNDVASPSGILYRVNVGGPELLGGSGGPNWEQDEGQFGAGENSDFLAANSSTNSLFNASSGSAHPGPVDTSDASIPAGTPAEIFDTERWDAASAPEMLWQFPVLAGTDVEVRLYFAELFGGIDAAGERVFDVSLEGSVPPTFDDIDPFATAGAMGGFMLSETVTVGSDGMLDIEAIHVTENPALKGIEILASAAPGTNDFALGVDIGDFSGDAQNPTVVNLAAGNNEIIATQEGDPNRDYDYATIVVPAGHELTQIMVDGFNDFEPSLVNAAFLGMQAGTQFTEDPANPDPANLLGGAVYSELDVGSDLLADLADGVVDGQGANTMGFSTPLGEGSYTLWWSQNGAPTTSELNFIVQPVQIGAASLGITPNSDDVQVSNFNGDSFQIANTGDKAIQKVEIDVTNALFPDSVFDPFGEAGDQTGKLLTINSDGNTGVVAPDHGTSGSPGTTYVGAGGVAGFEGIQLLFDANDNGGFQPGETLGFNVDMDPNSIAGAIKGTLDSGAAPDWDIGGISGAELIGSSFTVTFTDGTTANGQLGGADNQGGGIGLASQDSPNLGVNLTVNGLAPGGVGTYDTNGPTVTVNGPVGETARVVLAKGIIQPLDNNFPDDPNDPNEFHDQLDAQLAALAASDFPANNAVEFQTVDIVLDGTDQDISDLFDFTEVPDIDLAPRDESQLPLGFVASVIDPNNGDLPAGPVSDPVYLTFAPQPEADLELAKTVDDVTPAFGDQVTFTLDLSNLGADDATNVQVEDLLGNGYTFVSASGDGSYDETTGIWDVGSVGSGGMATLDITATVNAPMTADTVVYRVNPGGTSHAAADGSSPDWAADGAPNSLNGDPPSTGTVATGVTLTGGNKFGNENGSPVIDMSLLPAGTSAVEVLFETERFGVPAQSGQVLDPQQWDFDVTNGDYTVNLYFAEIFQTQAGAREFDISIEGTLVADNLDLYAEAAAATGGSGKDVALLKSFDTTVSDSVLDIDLLTEVDNAKISAIEIIQKGNPVTLDYANAAEVVAVDQFDPDSMPGNGVNGEDDYSSVSVNPSAAGQNEVSIAAAADAAEPAANGQFLVSLEDPAATDTVIAYTVSGSATSDSDFVALSGAVTIAAGDLSASIDVNVIDDALLEPDEDVTITLGAVTAGDANVVLGAADAATVSIVDDELPPPPAVGATVTVSGSTTFGTSAFNIQNTSDAGVLIKNVEFDIGTAILSAGLDLSGNGEFLGAVWDPTGEAGDAGSQGIQVNSGVGNAAGFLDENAVEVTPVGNLTTSPYPFSGQLPGGDNGDPGGFRLMDLDFSNFDPGEAFQFGVDVDPQSIQNASGTGQAGAVSGGEIAGSTVTITFEDTSTGDTVVQTRQLELTGLNSSEAVFTNSGPTPAPILNVVGLTNGVRRLETTDTDHVVEVSGLTQGDAVELYIVDASGYQKHGGDGSETVPDDPFHANQFDTAPTVLSGVADTNGVATFNVTLNDVAGAAPTTVDSLFFFSAGIVDANGELISGLAQPAELKVVTAPQQTVVVYAGSEAALGADADFELFVDGVLRGTATAPSAGFDAQNGTGYTPIAFTYDGASPADSVEVVFTNDAYNGNLGYDRNLFVDKIEVNGTEFEAEVDGNFLTDDPNLQTALGGSREDIRVNGALTFDIDAGPLPQQTVVVYAGSEAALGADADFELFVDGVLRGTATAPSAGFDAQNGTGYTPIAFTYGGASPADSVEVVFTNDAYNGNLGYDRNLFVDKIEVDGTEFEAEVDGNFLTDDPNLQTALGGSREDIRVNGALTFDIDAGPLPQQTVVVYAGSEAAFGADADFELFVDGVLRGTATAPSAGFDAQNGTGYTPIAFTYGGASPADSVEVVFTNDAYNGNLGEDRNLFVDKIEVNGTEFEAEVDGNFLTDDPNLQTALGGSREDIRVNGALTFDLTPAATQSLTVFAGGEEAQGNLPSFDVLVDGAVIGGDTVTNAVQNAPFDGVFDQFDFTYQGNPTPDRIQIVYDSDFYVSPGGDDNDSNLFVDKIALNGVEFEAENDGNFVTDDPSLQTALGGSREDLRANGILTFDDVFSA